MAEITLPSRTDNQQPIKVFIISLPVLVGQQRLRSPGEVNVFSSDNSCDIDIVHYFPARCQA